MKKVHDLEGAELDFWVAKGEGLDKMTEQQQRDRLYLKIIGDSCYLPSGGAYRPSSDWSQAGPIIERGKCRELRPLRMSDEGGRLLHAALAPNQRGHTMAAQPWSQS